MTSKELYDYVKKTYGNRECWISGLSERLNISYEDANYLTTLIGYSRGKLEHTISIETFSDDEYVKDILKTINGRK